jgi:hypothetical protein
MTNIGQSIVDIKDIAVGGRHLLIAVRPCLRHADAMGRDPAERTAPDPFPTATSALPASKATTATVCTPEKPAKRRQIFE